jgi:hypothetical protein
MTLEHVKTFLEMGFFVAGIVVCIVSIISLKQLRILQADSLTRNQRAAAEKAIEYGDRYGSKFVPLHNAWHQGQKENKIPSYAGVVGDFSFGSLSKTEQETALLRSDDKWLSAFNELNTITDAFVHGVADEGIGYHSIGWSYCNTVETMYDTICFAYTALPVKDDGKFGISGLYRLWSSRLKASALGAKESEALETLRSRRREKEELLKELQSSSGINAIGTK